MRPWIEQSPPPMPDPPEYPPHFSPGSYVRLSLRGSIDHAQVIDVDFSGMVLVKLYPRIDYAALKSRQFISQRRLTLISAPSYCPPSAAFRPSDLPSVPRRSRFGVNHATALNGTAGSSSASLSTAGLIRPNCRLRNCARLTLPHSMLPSRISSGRSSGHPARQRPAGHCRFRPREHRRVWPRMN
jgi:hypothetical protein